MKWRVSLSSGTKPVIYDDTSRSAGFSQSEIRRPRESLLSAFLACNPHVETNGPESRSASLVPTNATLMSLEIFHFTPASCRCSWSNYRLDSWSHRRSLPCSYTRYRRRSLHGFFYCSLIVIYDFIVTYDFLYESVRKVSVDNENKCNIILVIAITIIKFSQLHSTYHVFRPWIEA